MKEKGSDEATVSLREDVASGTAILFFSISQGMTSVLVPLVATAAGYGLGMVGFLVGVSAVAQLVARAGMGQLLDLFSTRTFLIAALCFMAISCLLLGFSAAPWSFVVSQLFQGAARGYFFTGAQTHVVRGARRSAAAMTFMNVTNGAGLLSGPVIAGFIGDVSLEWAMLVSAGISIVAIPAAILMVRYEPFGRPVRDPGIPTVRMWRRPGVATSGWMAATAGSWRALLSSYLPVLITEAGHSIPMAGVMTTIANVAALVGAGVATTVRRLGIRASCVIGIVLTAGGVATTVFLLHDLVLAGIFLAVSAVGAGIMQTLGPALGADVVAPQERGRAMATIGTFRAVSLLLTPMGIGALVFVLPSAAVASAVVSVVMAIPALVGTRSAPRRLDGREV